MSNYSIDFKSLTAQSKFLMMRKMGKKIIAKIRVFEKHTKIGKISQLSKVRTFVAALDRTEGCRGTEFRCRSSVAGFALLLCGSVRSIHAVS